MESNNIFYVGKWLWKKHRVHRLATVCKELSRLTMVALVCVHLITWFVLIVIEPVAS